MQSRFVVNHNYIICLTLLDIKNIPKGIMKDPADPAAWKGGGPSYGGAKLMFECGTIFKNLTTVLANLRGLL